MRSSADSACFDQHELGQELRQGGKLLDSRAAFLACAAAQCPAAVQRDCERWSTEVAAELHSVVFRVSSEDKARSDASVGSDGAPQPHALGEAVAAPERPGRVPTLSWVLGGVGVASTASFVSFGLSSRSLEHRLEASCSPLCTQDQIDRVRTRSLIANLSLGVGLVSLAGAGVLYFLSAPGEPEAPGHPTLRLSLVPLGGNGALANVELRAF